MYNEARNDFQLLLNCNKFVYEMNKNLKKHKNVEQQYFHVNSTCTLVNLHDNVMSCSSCRVYPHQYIKEKRSKPRGGIKFRKMFQSGSRFIKLLLY